MATSSDFLLRRLRLRHLQLLTLLEREGSLRAASAVLNLTQPAVSKMLHEIEEAFEAKLFERNRHGVQPNMLGRTAIHCARVVLGEIERTASEVEAMRGGAAAILRLGTVSITSIVPAAIVDLRERMPGALVRIREAALSELLRLLLDGEIDCVFGAVTPDALGRHPLDRIQVEVIFEDRICALVSERHRLACSQRLAWRDLGGLRWVAPPHQTLVRDRFIAAFLNLGHSPPEPVVETLSPVTMIELLRIDEDLIGAVRFESARLDALPGLRRLEIDDTMQLPPLCAMTRRTTVAAPVIVSTFIETLRKAAQARPQA